MPCLGRLLRSLGMLPLVMLLPADALTSDQQRLFKQVLCAQPCAAARPRTF